MRNESVETVILTKMWMYFGLLKEGHKVYFNILKWHHYYNTSELFSKAGSDTPGSQSWKGPSTWYQKYFTLSCFASESGTPIAVQFSPLPLLLQ